MNRHCRRDATSVSAGVRVYCGLLAAGSCFAQSPQLRDLRDLQHIVSLQEDAVPFLRVHAFGAGETRVGNVMLPYETIVTVVRDTDPAGRFVYDYEVKTLRDAERHFRDSIVMGYNGVVGWTLRRSTFQVGVYDAPLPLNIGTITAGRPAVASHEASIGWHATLPGFFEEYGRTFSEALSIAEVPFQLEVDPVTEDAVLVCQSKDKNQRDRWVLRKQWGYCLQLHEQRDKAGALRLTTEILEATKLTPAFWYPTKVRSQRFDEGGAVKGKHSFDVLEVERMEVFDDAVFAPTFPHGAVVTDHITGKTLRLAGQDAASEGVIREQASHMQGLVDYGRHSGGRWVWWLSAAAVICCSLLFLRRKRGIKSIHPKPSHPRISKVVALLFALPLVQGVSPAAAQEPWIMGVLANCKADNPGIGIMVLVSQFFDDPVSMSEAAVALDCGDGRSLVPTLPRIRRALECKGYRCELVRHVDVQGILGAVRAARGLGILAIDEGLPFPSYVAVAPSRKGVLVARPLVGLIDCVWGDREVGDLNLRMGGASLVVFGTEAVATWRIDHEPEHRFALGAIANSPSAIDISVKNDGLAAMTFESSKSSCSCIDAMEFVPARLEPGCSGCLRLHLVGSRMSSAGSDQLVELQCTLGDIPVVRRLTISASRLATDSAAGPAVVPALAFADADGLGCKQAAISVIVPNGGMVVATRGDPGVEAAPSIMAAVDGGVAVRYCVRWRSDRAIAEFVVRDADGKDSVVQCALLGTLRGMGR